VDVLVRHASAAAITTAALVLAACTGTDEGPSAERGTPGGTLYYLSYRPLENLDPQRVYTGRDIANLSRLVYRGLVTLPVTDDPDEALRIVPDVATDGGRPSHGSRVWRFTIRDGVTWQDGKPVTCEDFRYGISRTFATGVILGGPGYALSYLDIPQKPSGLPAYNGPYKGDGQAYFDRAVTCDGSTLTLRFRRPWPDFPYAAAALRAFDPYRRDHDRGGKSKFDVFSDGPYRLDGSWDEARGGTFVRNPEYDPDSDETGTRSALPDRIVFVQGFEPDVVYDRLVANAGKDRYAVTDLSAPPFVYSQITGAVAERSTLVDSPFVDYLVPNFRHLTDVRVRRALLLATDVAAYAAAQGGDRAGTPARSLVHPSVIGYRDNPAFTGPPEGDPEAARALLEQSGVDLPYPITLTYQGRNTRADKAAAALAEGWKEAGFGVSLEPLTDTYWAAISFPTADFDVAWAVWAADWPSMETVLPPLFDSRFNLSEESNGQDYGNYDSDVVNAMIDRAASMTDIDDQTAAYAEIDAQLGRDVAYIPLEVGRSFYLRGSGVTGFLAGPATSGYPDLGSIGVEN
jgi:peptide/nickel transport system substrate-binding protein